MVIRVVQLGTARAPDEGTRIGTVRRPPRGVPKANFASGNWYDTWFPVLAPSVEAMKLGQAANDDKDWGKFVRKYKSEMSELAAEQSLALLATLSHTTNLSVGCYCEDESRCHRSILRELLTSHGAKFA